MADETTRVILKGETEGFDKVQQVVDNVVGAVEGGGGNPGVIAALDKALSGIADSLGKIDAAVAGVAKSAEDLKGAAGGAGTSATAGRRPPREPPRPGESAGMDPSFLRGLLQGIGVAQYLPGVTPGALLMQAAGATTGRAAAGVGGGVGASAFTGIQGISSAFGSIPGVGPVAQGMAQAAIAAVEDALELQRAELDSAPVLSRGRARAAGAAELARALGQPLAASQSPLLRQFEGQTAGPMQTVFNHETGQVELRPVYPGMGGPGRADLLAADDASVTRMTADRERRARASAVRAARAATYGEDFEGLGERYGRDRTELTRDVGELMRARGGFFDPSTRGLGGALAARAGFGVDLATSGTLLRGERAGAFGGGSPAGLDDGDRLAQMIGNALKLGLEGGEVVEHLQRMADGIRRFETTGIPLAAASIDSVASTLMGSGMTNSVAAGRAAALTAAVQKRASEGLPGSAVDFASLVHLGGYAGGGTEEALAARARLVRGDFQAGGMDQLTKLFGGQLGTGPFGRAFGVEQGFQRMGLSLNPDEAMALDARSQGGQLSKAQQEAIARAEGRFRRGFSNLGELEDDAAGAVGGGLQRQAGIRNIRRAAGEGALDVVQDFERRAAIASQAFAAIIDKAKLLAPILDALVDGFGEAVRVTTGKVVTKSGQ